MPSSLELMLGPGRKVFKSPDAATLETALCGIAGHEGAWATLSWSTTMYITVTVSQHPAFIIETETGGRDFHSRLMDDELALESVMAIFRRFAEKDMSWTDDHEWQRVGIQDIDFEKAPETIQGIF